jgi:O-antigen/teichoic acid export membrane protein
VIRRPVSNVVASGAAQLTIAVSGFAIQLIVARTLGSEGYGIYSYALGLASMMAFLADLNLAPLVTRDLTRDPQQADGIVGTSLGLTLVASSVASLMVIGWVVGTDGRTVVVASVALAALTVAVRAVFLLAQACFRAVHEQRAVVFPTVLGRLAALGATIGLLVAGGGAASANGAQAIGWGFAAMLGIAAWRRRGHRVVPVFDLARWKALVWRASPFALNKLWTSIYIASDVVLLKELAGMDEAGLYKGAAVVVTQLPLLGVIVGNVVYPRMAKISDPDDAGALLSFHLEWMLLMGLPIAVGGLLVYEELMLWMLGEHFMAAAVALAIMLPMVPLRFVNNALALALTARDLEGRRVRAVAAAALLNVVGNLIVIPTYGALGAASTTLATEIFLGVAFFVLVRERVHLKAPRWGRVAVANLVMAMVILAMPTIPVWGKIAVAVAAYVVLVVGLGVVSRDSLARLRSL